jgi:thymidylate synthase
MTIKSYDNYNQAEWDLVNRIVFYPDFITKTTNEVLNTGFVLTNPLENKNAHSNYDYAQKFFEWMISNQAKLSKELVEVNPWVQRFMDTTELPEGFSSSYSSKIGVQLDTLVTELVVHGESRRAYLNILFPTDQVILMVPKSTHEYPCTIGLHFFIRPWSIAGKTNVLHMIVNMRSNNCWSVMPYDVYNFTMLQKHVADLLGIGLGKYYHQINNAHIYKGDVRRIRENIIH